MAISRALFKLVRLIRHAAFKIAILKNSLAVPRDESSSQIPTPIALHIFSGGPFITRENLYIAINFIIKGICITRLIYTSNSMALILSVNHSYVHLKFNIHCPTTTSATNKKNS